jgi:hypothetical protein
LTHARDQGLAERERELLPVGYAHVVFTLPHALAGLALQNKRVVYDLLFQASAATLLEIARTPKHLGAGLGFSQRPSHVGPVMYEKPLCDEEGRQPDFHCCRGGAHRT